MTWLAGHPYEPTIAVSGIDKTIKIFSPDARAQYDARRGINIADPDAEANIPSTQNPNTEPREDLGLKSCKRMSDSYQIMSQNDVDRQGGMSEAYITVRAVQPFNILTRRVLFSEWSQWFGT